MPDHSLDSSITIQIGGVNVSDEGTIEDYSRDRNSSGAIRRLRCAWLDRFKVITALQYAAVQVGTVTLVVGGAQYPDVQQYFVDNIHVEGEGVLGNSSNNMVAYTWAILSVRYVPIDYAAPQTQIDFGKEIISYGPDLVKFSGGGTISQPVPIPVTVVSLRQSRFNLPHIPIQTILTATANPMNSETIFGAPPGYILFDGGRSLMRWNIANGAVDPTQGGSWNFDIEYSFLYRPIRWDYFLDVDGTYKQVVRQDGSDLIGSSDLNALFQ